MRKTLMMMISISAILVLLYCDRLVNDPEICATAATNAKIYRIGYNDSNSMLSICFINALSYCTPDLPYQTNRLDVSMTSLESTYTSNKTDEQQLLPLPQGSKVLFNGEIACYDSCRISIPIDLPHITLKYKKHMTGDISLEIDTSGNTAGTFGLWNLTRIK